MAFAFSIATRAHGSSPFLLRLGVCGVLAVTFRNPRSRSRPARVRRPPLSLL